MTKNKIYFYMGLPASGKTTDAKERIKNNFNKIKRVNKDDLRNMLDAGKWSKDSEKFIVKVRDAIITLALQEKLDVIVDDTNLAEKHLQRIDELANKHSAGVEIVDFTDVPVNECIKRDQKRTNYVGERVIRKMYNQFLTKPLPKLENLTTLQDAYIFDIDSTLAIRNDRSPFAFHLCESDSVNEYIRNIINNIKQPRNIFLVSGRPDFYREITKRWLKSNEIEYLALYMRKSSDFRSDDIIKREIYEEFIHGKYRVMAVYDDRLRVVRMWHQLGLPVFRVGDPDLDF